MAQRSYTISEAAKELGCSDRHCLKLIRTGALRAFHVGLGTHRKSYRITEEALCDFTRRAADPTWPRSSARTS